MNNVIVSFEVDAEVLEKFRSIVEPMGLTVEQAIIKYCEWIVNKSTREQALLWPINAKAEDKF